MGKNPNRIFNDKEKPVRYNIRFGGDRDGAVSLRTKGVKNVNFLVLYNFENERDFTIYRVVKNEVKTQDEMASLNYPTPQGNYILYSLGEQVIMAGIDVPRILLHKRIDRKAKYIDGSPLFLEGWKI